MAPLPAINIATALPPPTEYLLLLGREYKIGERQVTLFSFLQENMIRDCWWNADVARIGTIKLYFETRETLNGQNILILSGSVILHTGH